MKTGFLYGYPNKPVKEYYSYHGMTRECLIQPDPGTFEEFDNEPPYGPEQSIKIKTKLNYSLFRTRTTYLSVWNATTAYSTTGDIGQNIQQIHNYYNIKRHFCSFDTSVLMPLWKITRAYVWLQYLGQNGDGGGDLVLQSGAGDYPKYPSSTSNYNRLWYSGNCGSIHIGGGVQIKIWLNAGGLGQINVFGRTKFALRTSDDIAGNNRDGLNYIYVNIYPSKQYLMVYYRRPLT